MRHLSLAKIEAICTGHARSSRQNKQEATLSLRVFHNFGRSSLWKIEVCLLKKVSRKSSTGRNSCPHALVVEENRITFVSGKKDISRCKIFWIKNKSNSILKIKLRSIVAFAHHTLHCSSGPFLLVLAARPFVDTSRMPPSWFVGDEEEGFAKLACPGGKATSRHGLFGIDENVRACCVRPLRVSIFT